MVNSDQKNVLNSEISANLIENKAVYRSLGAVPKTKFRHNASKVLTSEIDNDSLDLSGKAKLLESTCQNIIIHEKNIEIPAEKGQNLITKYTKNPPKSKVVYERFSDIINEKHIVCLHDPSSATIGLKDEQTERKYVRRKVTVKRKKEEVSAGKVINTITKYFPKNEIDLQSQNGKRKFQLEPTEENTNIKVGKYD